MKASEAAAQARALWLGMDPRRRLVLVAASVSVFTLLMGWTYFAGRPEFTVLYNRLDPKDASAIVSVLGAQGTPYRLADGGATILVPARDVHATRLALAGEGLPNQGSPGFELLEGISIGATEFERRAAYVRALSGELARTISQISQVESARVHVVLPEQSLFLTQSRPTTAAVFVKHRPGAKLDADQVRGIIHLVARSVEGLSPESVTVVDEGGRVLSSGEAGTVSTSGRAAGNLEASRQASVEIERGLQRLLEQVLGPGNVAARVTAELSFDESVINRRLSEAPGDSQGLVRSVQELTEYFRGTEEADGGVAGTQSNVPIYQSGSGGQTSSERERTETVKNFELNEITEHTVVAPGAVKRLSVSVVVNKELTAAEVERLERLVSAAVGSDAGRNDQIVVTGMPFNTELAQTVLADMAAQRRNQLVAIGSGVGLALLAGLVLLLRARRAASRRRNQPVVVAEEVGPQLAEADITRIRMQEELAHLFRQKPQAAAQVIRSWLAEE